MNVKRNLRVGILPPTLMMTMFIVYIPYIFTPNFLLHFPVFLGQQ